MPLYEVSHITPLASEQKEELAKAITKIHSEKFTTPSVFVNVIYTDVSERDAFVGGKSVCDIQDLPQYYRVKDRKI